jgi:D-aminopeptidase
MHAASGTDGFLAHTLTSRIQRLEVNGRHLTEVELFSASLAPHAVKPVFFSGCPVACAQAKEAIAGIHAHPIDKSNGPGDFDANRWRSGLAGAAVESLDSSLAKPYAPTGLFHAVVTMRPGATVARRLARRWSLAHDGAQVFIDAHDLNDLYHKLVRMCYLTPLAMKVLPMALLLNNLKGRVGLAWVRRRLRLKQ